MNTVTHRRPQGMHIPPKAFINADIFGLALAVISGDAQESARIRADLAANVDKAGKAHKHDERMALRDQNKWEAA